MKLYVDNEGTTESLQRTVQEALAVPGTAGLVILASDRNSYIPDNLDPFLKSIEVSVVGGIFPGIMNNGRLLDRGNLVLSLKEAPKTYFIPGLSDEDADYEDRLDALVGEEEFKTLLVFLDGLSVRIKAFIDALYTTFGLEVNYIGGGAGSSSLKRSCCLFTNDGMRQDGAVLAALNLESGVGVRHGWTSVSGPYQVTEAEGNTIKTLDWQSALEVYLSVVIPHSGRTPEMSAFMNLSLSYPFGIAKLGTERVIREVIGATSEGALISVGEVPVGEYVDILNAETPDLIHAAGEALNRAKDNFPDKSEPGLGLLIDCMSRKMLLEEDFVKEVAEATPAGLPSAGVCTLGEIANSGRDYLEFYNKTAVVALLEDE